MKIIEKNGKRYRVRYFGKRRYLYCMDKKKPRKAPFVLP